MNQYYHDILNNWYDLSVKSAAVLRKYMDNHDDGMARASDGKHAIILSDSDHKLLSDNFDMPAFDRLMAAAWKASGENQSIRFGEILTAARSAARATLVEEAYQWLRENTSMRARQDILNSPTDSGLDDILFAFHEVIRRYSVSEFPGILHDSSSMLRGSSGDLVIQGVVERLRDDMRSILVDGAYQFLLARTTDQDRRDMIDALLDDPSCKSTTHTVESAVNDYAKSVGLSVSCDNVLTGYDSDMLIARVIEKVSESPFRGVAYDAGGPDIRHDWVVCGTYQHAKNG